MNKTFGIFGHPGSGCNFIMGLIKFYMVSENDRQKFFNQVRVSPVGDFHAHWFFCPSEKLPNMNHCHLIHDENFSKEKVLFLSVFTAQVKILITYEIDDFILIQRMVSRKNFHHDYTPVEYDYTEDAVHWVNKYKEYPITIDHFIKFKTLMGLNTEDINQQIAAIMNEQPDARLLTLIHQYQKINRELYIENPNLRK